MFEDLVEMVRRDITRAMPAIRRKGVEMAKYDLGLSKNMKRKLGLLPNPWAGHGRWKKKQKKDPRFRLGSRGRD